MNTTIKNWVNRLHEQTHLCIHTFGNLNVAQLNWQPNTDSWSIGQCIDHLITTNQTYLPILAIAIEGEYEKTFMEKIPFLPTFFGKLLLKSVQPNNMRKIKTMPVFEPAQSNIPDNIVREFELHQQNMAFMIQNTENLYHHKIIITSPANKYLTYSLYHAIEIIIAHEQRHLQQAKRVLDRMKI